MSDKILEEIKEGMVFYGGYFDISFLIEKREPLKLLKRNLSRFYISDGHVIVILPTQLGKGYVSEYRLRYEADIFYDVYHSVYDERGTYLWHFDIERLKKHILSKVDNYLNKMVIE